MAILAWVERFARRYRAESVLFYFLLNSVKPWPANKRPMTIAREGERRRAEDIVLGSAVVLLRLFRLFKCRFAPFKSECHSRLSPVKLDL